MLRWVKGDKVAKAVVVVFRFTGDPPAADPALPGVGQDEPIEAIHEEFARTFCHRPGENLVAHLRKAGTTRLLDWLAPEANSAESMAFVRLAVDATRKGMPLWEQTGFHGFRDGGPPPIPTQDALSVLAQTLGKPIKLYYEKPDGATMVLDFAP